LCRRHAGRLVSAAIRVEAVNGNRALSYSQAAAMGVSHAVERWRLLGNLREAVEQLAQARTAAVLTTVAGATSPDNVTPQTRVSSARATADFVAGE
jgi:hypothetical protein